MEILGISLIALVVILLIIGIILFPRSLTQEQSDLIDKHFPQSEWHIEKNVVEKEEWIELVEGQYPQHEVVLVSNKYGTIHACWWNHNTKCWYVAGNAVMTTPSTLHGSYTHYRKLPNPPKDNK